MLGTRHPSSQSSPPLHLAFFNESPSVGVRGVNPLVSNLAGGQWSFCHCLSSADCVWCWTHCCLRLLAIELVISSTPFYKFIDTESCPLCHHVLTSFSRSFCSLVLPQGVVALTSLRDFYSKNIGCRQTFFSLNTLIISELNTNPSEA